MTELAGWPTIARSKPDDAMRRIRDTFGVYDGIFDDDC